ATRPSWASASARIPSWANGRTPGSWASTAAAAGPGSWPRRPSQRWRLWARAASGSAAGRWHYWKGIVDESPGFDPGPDPRAGRPEAAVGGRARSARRRDPRRADRRGRTPLGPLRQQPGRGRALPGLAPDLRLHPGSPDLGYRSPDLPPQADHRPGGPVAHDPHQGGPDGLPQSRGELVRP